MELIPSNRRQETGLATRSQQPWAIAIRETYGELPAFTKKFTPAAQRYCAANTRKAVEDSLPTFGRIVATYGEKGIASIINTHITEAIARMGEDRDVDPYDVQFIAEAICESDRFKTLRFPSIFGFFHLLKCGEFDIYGKVTPRKILEAFRKYAIDQQARENRMAYEKECREAEEERERSRAAAVKWEDYAAAHNLPDKDWASYVIRSAKEYQERQALWSNLAGALRTLIGVITFIATWKEQQKRPQEGQKRPK